MKLQKSQLSLIISLNFALILIVCAIFVELFTSNTTNAVSVSTPPLDNERQDDYSLSRSARISLSSYISLESNLGGSGDDEFIDAFSLNDKIYLFGNTNSVDYDMNGRTSQSFMAVLNSSLTIENIYFIGESNSRLEKVIIIEKGFLAIFNRSGVSVLTLYSDSGEILRSTVSDSSGSSDVCDLFLVDNGFCLVTAPHKAPIGKNRLLLQVYKFDLSLQYERTITTAYNVEYLNAYNVGSEFLVFYRAFSDLGSHLGVAVCSGDIAVKTITSKLILITILYRLFLTAMDSLLIVSIKTKMDTYCL